MASQYASMEIRVRVALIRPLRSSQIGDGEPQEGLLVGECLSPSCEFCLYLMK